MHEYHKIQTCFKRDEATKRIIDGDWTLPEFEYLKNTEWVWTEKVDGTNIRVMWDGTAVTFGGKTDNAAIPVKLLYALQALFEGTPKRKLFGDTFGTDGQVCLYGEGFGGNIQAGDKYGDFSFVLFDVRVGSTWLERENVDDIASKLGTASVPVIGKGTLQSAIDNVRAGFDSQWGNFVAEGIVARPAVELMNRKGERIITKIKHRDFGN